MRATSRRAGDLERQVKVLERTSEDHERRVKALERLQSEVCKWHAEEIDTIYFNSDRFNIKNLRQRSLMSWSID